MKVGEIIPADREIVLNEGKKNTTILVANKGDRPVQVLLSVLSQEKKKKCS